MKKLFTVLMCLSLMVFATTGFAEQIKYKEKGYDFDNVKAVYLNELVIEDVMEDNFTEDATAASKVKLALRVALAKEGLTLHEAEPTTEESGLTRRNKEAVQMNVTIHAFGNIEKWREPWTEHRNRTKDVTYQDADGKTSVLKVPYVETIEHDGHYEYVSQVDLEVNVVNARTDKLLYSLRDNRYRAGKNNTAGMLQRICNEVADDIS